MLERIQSFSRIVWHLTNKGIRGAALGGALAPGPGTVIGAIISVLYSICKKIFYRMIRH